MVRAEDVVDLSRALSARRLDWCLVGGWGVDALLGRQTRPHADLDVLLSVSELPEVLALLQDRGFALDHLWEEGRTLPGPLPLLPAPSSAFVLEDADGRQVDVHVTDVDAATPLWSTDRTLVPADLDAVGRVGTARVRCMTARTQLRCHTGYRLPPEHAADVERLRALVGP